MDKLKIKHVTSYAVLLIAVTMPSIAISSLAGAWAEDCNNSKNGIIIEKAVAGNLYQLIGCASFKCILLPGKEKPTPIYGDIDFSDISDKKITFRGKRLKKCMEFKEINYEKFDLSEVSRNIIGKWKEVSVARIGKTFYDPDGRVFDFRNDGKLVSISRGNGGNLASRGRELKYSTEGNSIIIKNGNKKRILLILSITNEELIVTFSDIPGSGAIKFQRIK